MHAFDDPVAILSRTRIVERILDYVRIDTQSDENSDTCPSIEKQFELGRLLVEELEELGLKGVGEPEVTMDENGYVLAKFPGTALGTVGLCAHMDTAPAFNGTGVSPQMVEG
jgi:tripeptide aminopeptidase